MAFDKTTRDIIYIRAMGRCECRMTACNHPGGRCNADLSGGWEAHHRHSQAAGGSDAPSNGVAMCYACHRQTLTFGDR